MPFDPNEEMKAAEASMDEARDVLLASGFTYEQMQHLTAYVQALIKFNQYAIMATTREISHDSAMKPGEFQSKVL